MVCNQNEKYLLEFISCLSNDSKQTPGLVELIYKLGLKPDFSECNSVYQIIDELSWDNYCKNQSGRI